LPKTRHALFQWLRYKSNEITKTEDSAKVEHVQYDFQNYSASYYKKLSKFVDATWRQSVLNLAFFGTHCAFVYLYSSEKHGSMQSSVQDKKEK